MKRIETLLYNLDLKKTKKHQDSVRKERKKKSEIEKEKENCTTKGERRKKT